MAKMQSIVEALPYKNFTGSNAVCAAPGKLLGIFVNSTSAGTLKLWDNASAGSGTVICNTITPAAGSFLRIPARFVNGLFITVGGTIDATVFYESAR